MTTSETSAKNTSSPLPLRQRHRTHCNLDRVEGTVMPVVQTGASRALQLDVFDKEADALKTAAAVPKHRTLIHTPLTMTGCGANRHADGVVIFAKKAPKKQRQRRLLPDSLNALNVLKTRPVHKRHVNLSVHYFPISQESTYKPLGKSPLKVWTYYTTSGVELQG